MSIAGSYRLYGTLRGTRLALDIPSDGGEIAQQVYNAVSEAEWNRVAARFKSFAGFVRQVQVLLDQRAAAHEEWARLKAADDSQKAELADLRKQLGPAKEQQRKAEEQLAQAKAALASGERKHAAAEAVAKAADELAAASHHCRTVDEARDAQRQVEASRAAVAEVAADIRADEAATLTRLAGIKRQLEERARAIKDASPEENDDFDVRSAAHDVGSAAFEVRSAVHGVSSAVFDLKSECFDANSEAQTAQGRVKELIRGIDAGEEQRAELEQRCAPVAAIYWYRDKKLKNLPRRPLRW
jgi:chromosome segregation ATPase